MEVNINVMQDYSEIIDYDEMGIPLYIRHGELNNYPEKRALCHWHDDIEFIKIIDGEMNYFVNGENILLKNNDTLMVNKRSMHYGYSVNDENCSFICIIFHPSLLSGNKILYNKYVKPILDNTNLEYVYFNPNDDNNKDILNSLDDIYKLKLNKKIGFELDVISSIYTIWKNIFKQVNNTYNDVNNNSSEIKIQKDMVSFIYQNYSNKLSLSDIAASGGVCRSKCCQIFKQYLRQSPNDFLNTYRLEVSCNLLKNTNRSITDIALSCGFNAPSYYIELFQRQYNCTPKNFRKKEACH